MIPCDPVPDPSVTWELLTPTTRDNSGALLQALPDWLLLVGQLIGPAPSPSSPPFRSNFFLRPLSLFFYDRLIHLATRALSGPVSHPAVFTGDEKWETWEREGETKRRTAHTWLHVSRALKFTVVYLGCVMSLTGLCAATFYFSCVRKCFIKREAGGGLWQVHSEAQESSLTRLSHCAQIKRAFPASHCVCACVYAVCACVCLCPHLYYKAAITLACELVKSDA